jgi:hypothetical protein
MVTKELFKNVPKPTNRKSPGVPNKRMDKELVLFPTNEYYPTIEMKETLRSIMGSEDSLYPQGANAM